MFAPKQDTFKRDYPFENNINQLKKDIEHDYKEVEKLYDIVLEGKCLSLVISILEAETKRYKEQLDFLLFSEKELIYRFEVNTPSFAYNSLFVSQYSTLYGDYYFSFRCSLIAEKDGDSFSPNHKMLEQDNKFRAEFWEKDNSSDYNDDSYIFTEKSYNANVDYFGDPGRGITLYWNWQEVLEEADNISIIRRKAQLIYAFYNDILKPMLDKLQPTPANLAEQNTTPIEDYKKSDWYKELSPETQTELDDILSDEKQPGFKPYIDKLFSKGYFKLDENYTPTLGKMSRANLKRLINKLTPQSINGKFVAWEKFFDIDKPLKNLSDYKKPKSFEALLKDLGIE